MATIFAPPAGIPVPDVTIQPWSAYEAAEEAYVKRIQDLARSNGKHEALGMVVRFPYADGYAQYVVWNTRPLQLVHLPIGDAWDLPDYVTRGIRLSDIVKSGGRMPAGGPVD